jgi:hypothetical protein
MVKGGKRRAARLMRNDITLEQRLAKERAVYDPNGEESCAACRFYDRDLCRRRAPVQGGLLDYHIAEVLAEIGRALYHTAGWTPGNSSDGEPDHPLNVEVTEAFQRDLWPPVNDDDWCGEFERASRTELSRRLRYREDLMIDGAR